MTIINTEVARYSRGVTPGLGLAAGGIAVLDVTDDDLPGLTLLPTGEIQIGAEAAGAWEFLCTGGLENPTGSSRTDYRTYVTFNGIEIPGKRRPVYGRRAGFGASFAMSGKLTNLIAGDKIAIYGLRTKGGGSLRVPTYGIDFRLEKVT